MLERTASDQVATAKPPALLARRLLFSALADDRGHDLAHRGCALAGRFGALDLVLVVLFAVTLPWYVIGFWNATIGFLIMRFARDPVAAGGWRINGLATLQSGTPLTIGCTVSTSAGMGCDALLVPGQGIYAGAHTLAHWLNAAAFANPTAARTVGQTDYSPLGGAPTQAVGPRFHRGDITVAKRWRTTESTFVEFRAEVFNLTNTPNFGQPGTLNFGTTKTFASITTTRDSPDDPREMQFALKFYF